MTFFLPARTDDELTAPAARVAPRAERAPSTATERLGAAFRAETLRTDAWQSFSREENETYRAIAERLGDASPLLDASRRDRRGLSHPAVRERLLEAARRAAEVDPGSWGDVPLTREGVRTAAAKRQREEYDDAQRTLRAAPQSAFAVETLGELAAGAADEVNVPLTILSGPAGLGGSTLRAIGRTALTEAALAGVGEAAMLDRQREAAERLGLPDPDALTQIAVAAATGGVLGGAVAAAPRVVAYALGRRQAGRDAGGEGRVDAAEAALAEGRPVAPPPPVDDVALRGVVQRIIQAESLGDPAARNARSTAGGLGQFLDDTWIEQIQRHRPDLHGSLSRAEVLALKTDPRQAQLQRDILAAFTVENREYLRSQGIDPTAGDLYLAHFLGPRGGRDALIADPNAPVSAVMDAAAIRANAPSPRENGGWEGGITFAGRPLAHMTVGDLRRWAAAKMGEGRDPGSAASAATRAAFTTGTEVVTPRGTRVEVTYEIVDADDLIFAQGGLQNRQRERPAPTAEVSRRAAELDPAQLLPSPLAGSGPPVVGPDGVIESGNGRVMSIREAADRFPDRFEAYRAALRAAGFDVPDTGTPVLIARRTTDLDPAARERFVTEANEDVVERLSVAEQALTDARALDDRVLGLYDPEAGEPTAAGNRPFLLGAVRAISGGRVGALIDGAGRLSDEGARRIRAALFARAYDDAGLVADMTERGGADLRGAVAALTQAAARWTAFRARVAAGDVGAEWDVTGDLATALRLVADARERARAEGLTVRGALADALAQGDMLGDGPSPAAVRLASAAIYRDGRARSADDLAAILRGYADEAEAAGASGDLLAGIGGGATPLDALDAVIARVNRQADERGGRVSAEDAGDVDELGNAAPDLSGFAGDAWSRGADAPAAAAAASEAEADLRAAIAAGPARGDAAPAAARTQDGDAVVARLEKWKRAQPFDDVEGLYALADDAQAELAAAAERAAEALGGRVEWKNPGVKLRVEADKKMVRKAYTSARQLTDVPRGGFVAGSVADADAVVEALAREGLEIADEGWTVTVDGYVDRKVIVRTSAGVLAEVQLWTREVLEAKGRGGGHDLYKRARASADPAERERLMLEMRELYRDAVERSDPELRRIVASASSPNVATNRSSDISPAVMRTSSASTSTAGAPGSSTATARPSGSSAAGRASQDTRFMGNTSDPEMTSGAGEVNATSRITPDERAEILAGGDFATTFDAEGNPLRFASEELDELAAEADAAEVIELCIVGGGRA